MMFGAHTVFVPLSKCAFAYAVNSHVWESLAADLDAPMLTTEVAGGFVGATVGP